jgi:hypothetical protein
MANTEEADKRLVEAADSVMTANEALTEARNTVGDTRFASEREQERTQAFQAAQKAADNTVKRLEESLKKATIAAALKGTPGAFAAHGAAAQYLATARNELRLAANADGMAAKQEKLRATVAASEAAINVVQGLVFA